MKLLSQDFELIVRRGIVVIFVVVAAGYGCNLDDPVAEGDTGNPEEGADTSLDADRTADARDGTARDSGEAVDVDGASDVVELEIEDADAEGADTADAESSPDADVEDVPDTGGDTGGTDTAELDGGDVDGDAAAGDVDAETCSPSTETCNGVDDDCDGKTDEMLSRSCGTSTGECTTGTEYCNSGTWGSCQNSTGPSAEKCDAKDNDCDGTIDENLSRTCGSSTGVCTTGTEYCSAGMWGSCQNNTGPSPESCDNKDNDCDGKTDEMLSRSCGTSTGECTEGTEYCNSGTWGSCQNNTEPSPETCDNKDNDCDGTTDEDADKTLLFEDFEGSDPLGWSKRPSGLSRLKIDDDVTKKSTPDGSEYGKAWYRTGTCKSVAGMAASKSLSGDVDEITVQVNIDIDNWGRAAIFVEDSSGNVTKLWSANAKGGGFTTNGWKKLTFDHSTSFKKTKSSGAVVEQNTIPSGLGNETVTFIFGNNDDSSYCKNSDHGWWLRFDAVDVTDICS